MNKRTRRNRSRKINRQIEEAIRSKNHDKETILNLKSEFYGPSMRRRILEGKVEECDKCNFKAEYRTALINHKKSAHENIELHCEQCNFNAK